MYVKTLSKRKSGDPVIGLCAARAVPTRINAPHGPNRLKSAPAEAQDFSWWAKFSRGVQIFAPVAGPVRPGAPVRKEEEPLGE